MSDPIAEAQQQLRTIEAEHASACKARVADQSEAARRRVEDLARERDSLRRLLMELRQAERRERQEAAAQAQRAQQARETALARWAADRATMAVDVYRESMVELLALGSLQRRLHRIHGSDLPPRPKEQEVRSRIEELINEFDSE
ncbi:MAG TPA: hypothetical protein ENI96_10010 [Sedimenticola thiotaurini]|uniref:Uncharacterized protein n=1 Tax=Sedimenticola thiotaurini TaxID=1543721 RepID=A0A831RNG5_9GAMM|nr:hypothetical protein [Sedimenticola thiotaurini]